MFRFWFPVGCLSALLSVALGAFGAHGLQLTGDAEEVYQTAVEYHMAHSLGILLAALASERLGARRGLVQWSALLLLIGIVLFSGSLYALSVTGLSWLGMIAPFGGTSFLIGWLLLAAAAWGARRGS